MCLLHYLQDTESVSATIPSRSTLVFDRLRKVEKRSIVMVVSPLVALMKDQVIPVGLPLHVHCLLQLAAISG